MKKEIAQKWYLQSIHDLEYARKNFEIQGYDIACFLSQQSVEKLLKSIVAYEKGKIPRTHYLDEIGKILELEDEISDLTIDLTADYTFSRYPDVTENVPYLEYTEEIANEKIQKAEKIFELLYKRYKDLLNEE